MEIKGIGVKFPTVQTRGGNTGLQDKKPTIFFYDGKKPFFKHMLVNLKNVTSKLTIHE